MKSLGWMGLESAFGVCIKILVMTEWIGLIGFRFLRFLRDIGCVEIDAFSHPIYTICLVSSVEMPNVKEELAHGPHRRF
jgi:hypothetical protein